MLKRGASDPDLNHPCFLRFHPQGDKLTALHIAANSGHLRCVQVLVHSGARIDARSDAQMTPLHCAAGMGHAAVVSELLRCGADADAAACDNAAPLHLAAANAHEGAISALLAGGAPVEAKRSEGQLTALHVAAIRGHSGAVRALLRGGADVHGGDKARTADTCLTATIARAFPYAFCGRFCVKRLAFTLSFRAQVGRTPLFYSAYHGRVEATKALLESGADIHLGDPVRKTKEKPTVQSNHPGP